MARPVLANGKLNLLPSGCTVLDCALGGGYPMGRIVNIVGDKSTGKSLLAIEATANFAHRYPQGDIYYVETEAAFDRPYAESLGMPVSRITFFEDVVTIEDFFERLVKVFSGRNKENPGILVLDSLDALSDRAESGRGIDEGSYGAAKAKKISEFFRRMIRQIQTNNVLVIIVSQVRDNINAMFGKKYTRSGGRALDFYASQIIYLAHVKSLRRTINKVDRAVGVIIKARLEKNKIGPPFREAQFSIRFGFGMDDVAACTTFLEESGGLAGVEYFNGGRSVTAKLNQLDKADDATYYEVLKQLKRATRQRWREIETNFAPQRKKYHG